MTITGTDLVMHFPLMHAAKNGKVKDESSHAYEAIVKEGQLEKIFDDHLGSCLRFDGKAYLDTNQNIGEIGNKDFTISMWIKTKSKNVGLIAKTVASSGALYDKSLYINNSGYVVYVGSACQYIPGNTDITDGSWHHVALTWNQSTNKGSIYINAKESTGKVDYKPRQDPAESTLKIGLKSWEASNNFVGDMAHVRIYNRALSIEDIQADMSEDEIAMAAYRRTHPLDFRIYNQEDDQEVFYMDADPTGHEMIFELTNLSKQEISLKTQAAETNGPSEHLLSLAFNPNTLANTCLDKANVNCIQIIDPEKNWTVNFGNTSIGGAMLYFNSTKEIKLAAGATLSLKLRGVQIDNAGGARGTHVVLTCPKLQYTAQNDLFSQHRKRRMEIVNHQGRKTIPLHVGFVGSNTILNDGVTSNNLTLRLTNTLAYDGTSRSEISWLDNTAKKSAFILLVEVAKDINEEWKFGFKSELEKITINGGKGSLVTDSTHKQGDSYSWEIHFPAFQWKAGEYKDIIFSNITTHMPSGTANIYLKYKNIPGYQDGQFICTVQRSPLVIGNSAVGVGTKINEQHKDYKLVVAGNILVDGGNVVVKNADKSAWQGIKGTGIGISKWLPAYMETGAWWKYEGRDPSPENACYWQYLKDSFGTIHLRGTLCLFPGQQHEGWHGRIGQLPSNCRPPWRMMFKPAHGRTKQDSIECISPSSGDDVLLMIDTEGNIIVEWSKGKIGWISLDGITFNAAVK